MDSVVEIEGLTDGDGIWRIVWFGYLNYDTPQGRWPEPGISVYLVKVKLDAESPEPFENLDVLTLRAKWFPVSYLSLMRLGDLWCKGRLFKKGNYKNITVSNINVRDGESVGVGISGNAEFNIQRGSYPFWKGAENSLCAFFNSKSSGTVIIPHIVILQSYFGANSYLLSQIFSGDYRYKYLYKQAYKKIKDNGQTVHYIELANNLLSDVTPLVARIAFSEKAKHSLELIDFELASCKLNNQPLVLRTWFPFDECVDLDLHGEYVKIANNQRAFLVYQISSCSGSFPFENLIQIVEKQGQKQRGKDTSGQGNPFKKAKKKKVIKLGPYSTNNNLIHAIRVPSFVETSFNNLTPMFQKVVFEEAVNREEATQSRDEVDHQTGNLCGTPHGSDGVKRTTKSEEENENGYRFKTKFCRLKQFIDAMKQLKIKYPDISYNFLQLNHGARDNNPYYSYFRRELTPKGYVKSWPYIELKELENDSENLRRGVIICEVYFGSKTYHIFEIERLMFSKNGGFYESNNYSMLFVNLPVDTKDEKYLLLLKILKSCAVNSGRWSKLGDILRTTKSHPENKHMENPKDYILRLSNQIAMGLGISGDINV